MRRRQAGLGDSMGAWQTNPPRREETGMTEMTTGMPGTAERERQAKELAARLSGRLVIGGRLVRAIAEETFPVDNPGNG